VVVLRSVRDGEIDDLIATFSQIGESLYAGVDHPARPSEVRTRSLLAASNPTARRCRVRLFVDERAPARVAAIMNPRLIEAGAPVGLLGFFEAAEDPAAVNALLTSACAWLYEQGCAVVRGPVNFTTWHDYRFSVDGGSPGARWIPGEPFHHDYYARLWPAAGFRVAGHYASHWVASIDDTLARFADRADRALASGVVLRGVETSDLPALYRMAIAGFAGNWMYSPIDPDEFAVLYAADRVSAGAGTSYVAALEGAPVGFYYTFPASLPGGTTSIGKTIVVDSALRDRGIYHLMMSAWLREAKTAGRRAIAALFHLDGSPALMGWQRAGDAFKNYVLFEHQR
jgi:hypothetical protein